MASEAAIQAIRLTDRDLRRRERARQALGSFNQMHLGEFRHMLRVDGGDPTRGDEFLCHACGRLRQGLGDALLCCSDRFDGGDV